MGRKKKSPKERRADRSLLSGIKSGGFRLPWYISLLGEIRGTTYSETSYKRVTAKTAEPCHTAVPNGRQ